MEIKNTINIDADLQDLIPQFIENRRRDILDLQKLIEAKDARSIALLAHKIKGSAAGYGFKDLSMLASDLENAVKNNDFHSLEMISKKMKFHMDNIEVKFIPL
jgi:HPt (histidine-containing phosphotransfer) domain-containing protein